MSFPLPACNSASSALRAWKVSVPTGGSCFGSRSASRAVGTCHRGPVVRMLNLKESRHILSVRACPNGEGLGLCKARRGRARLAYAKNVIYLLTRFLLPAMESNVMSCNASYFSSARLVLCWFFVGLIVIDPPPSPRSPTPHPTLQMYHARVCRQTTRQTNPLQPSLATNSPPHSANVRWLYPPLCPPTSFPAIPPTN